MSAAKTGGTTWARAHGLGALPLFLLLATAACSDGGSSPAAFGDDEFKRHGELRITPSEVRVREGDSVAVSATLVGGSAFDPSRVQWSVVPSHAGVIRDGHFVASYYGDVTIGASYSGTSTTAAAEVLPAPHAIRIVGSDYLAGTAGQALPDSVRVHVTGRNGVNVPDFDVEFRVVQGDGTLSATQARTDWAGMAKVAWRLGGSAGSNALQAVIPGVAESRVEAWGYADLSTATLELLDGNAQEGQVAEVLPQPLAVRVSDQNGNPIRGVTVEWRFRGGDGSESGVFSTAPQVGDVAVRAVTDVAGVSVMHWRLGTIAGEQDGAAAIVASGSGAPSGSAWTAPGGNGGGNGRSDFSAKAKPGHVEQIVISPSETALEVDATSALTAMAVDKWGNTMDGVSFEWSAVDARIATVDPVQGIVEGEHPGATTVSASYAGKSGSAGVTVLSGTPTSIKLGGDGQQGTTGAPLAEPLTALVMDQHGAPVANVTVAWQVASGGGTVSAEKSKTNAQGIASVTWTLGSTEGEQQASATVSGIAPVSYVAQATAPAVASVTLSPSSLTMQVGDPSTRLVASLRDGSGTMLVSPLTWSSTNTAVATVDQEGNVTAVAPGNAQIRASADGSVGTSAVTVLADEGDGGNDGGVVRIEATPSSYTFTALGNSTQLLAVGYDASGNPVAVSFAWSSSDPDVASVDQSGRLTSKMVGVAKILACVASCTVADTVSVNVTQVAKSLDITPASLTLDVGQTTALSAAARDSNGNGISGAQITWTSSNTSVATIDGSGKVTGKAPGSVTFKGTVDGVSDTSAGSVEGEATPAKVELSPTSMSMTVGGQKQIIAVVKDAAGNVISDPSIYWESSNTAIARVNSTGVVTAYESGSVTIKATSGSSYGTTSVTVGSGSGSFMFGRSFATEVEAGWQNYQSPGTFDVISDAGATDGSTVGRMTFPKGMGSTRPAITTYSSGWESPVVRLEFRVKFSENWRGHNSGTNKIFYITDSSTGGGGDPAFIKLHGANGGALHLRVVLQSPEVPNRVFRENIGSVEFVRGRWYEVEVVLKYQTSASASNGEVHAWVNGSKVIEYTDVQWSTTGDRTFDSLRWEPYWGGQGDTLDRTQYQYIDYIRVSGG